MKQLVVIAAIVMTVLAAGCNSNTAQTGSRQAQLIEPCELISRAQAGQLVGEPMKVPEKRENKVVGQKLCIYHSAKKGSFRFLQISITQQALMPGGGQSPKSIYESLKANFPKAVKVAGVGDDAFIAPPGLHILKGDYYITIAVGNSDDSKNREILKAAGKQAIGNLLRLEHK